MFNQANAFRNVVDVCTHNDKMLVYGILRASIARIPFHTLASPIHIVFVTDFYMDTDAVYLFRDYARYECMNVWIGFSILNNLTNQMCALLKWVTFVAFRKGKNQTKLPHWNAVKNGFSLSIFTANMVAISSEMRHLWIFDTDASMALKEFQMSMYVCNIRFCYYWHFFLRRQVYTKKRRKGENVSDAKKKL